MDKPHDVASPLKKTSVENNSVRLSSSIEVPGGEDGEEGSREGFVGVLQVHIHEASDIQDICIYQKQDVYAKLYLTSDPEHSTSTQVVHGGGRNPIFDETLELDVRNLESSLKCEVWMLSRVRNYLVDQFLGFALIPLCQIINEKIVEKKYSLSLSDLAPTISGLVKLSLSYCGITPEVMAIPAVPPTNTVLEESDASEIDPSPYETIEFPDPHILKENQMMISEYLELMPGSLDCEGAEQLLGASENKNEASEEIVSSNEDSGAAWTRATNLDTTPKNIANQEASPTSAIEATVSQTKQQVLVSSAEKDTKAAQVKSDSDSTDELPKAPTFNFNTKTEEPQVVQQDIVDMYMKSMQQFTDSLSKMKLPLDSEDEPLNPATPTSSNPNLDSSKASQTRVFYGSRAFF